MRMGPPDGAEQLLHEIGVGLIWNLHPGVQHLVVCALHQPLLQLDNVHDIFAL